MMVHANKSIIFVAASLLLACTFAAVYADQPVLLFAPLALLTLLYLLQQPRLLFYTLIAFIPWSAEVQFTESLGTDLPDEPLMLVTAFAAIALWLHHSKKKKNTSVHPLLFILGASICWLAITVATSTYPLFSMKYFLAKGWYLLAFVAMPLLLRDEEKLVKNSAVVLALSMFIATLLVFLRHTFTGLTFATINTALQPFFRNHVNYSALLVLTVPLQVAFIRQTKSKTIRRLLFISLIVVTGALFFSYARGAWLAFVVGICGFWLIKNGWLFKTFLLFVAFVLLTVAWLKYNDNYLQFAPNYNNTIFHENFSEHLAATYQGKDVSTAERFYRWVAGANMSREKWFTGFGPTTFYPNYKSYTVPAFRTWVSNNSEHSTVHNYFLLLLIEQGIPGLILFLLLLGGMFWYAQKIYRRSENDFWKTTVAAVGAILLMQCTLNFLSDLIETDKAGSVFYLCVAVLVMADRSQETGVRIQENENT